MIVRPSSEEMNQYFGGYVGLVEGDDALPVLQRQGQEIEAFFGRLDEGRLNYRYAEGKWSLKEMFGHLIDAERMFLTRALAFARCDPAERPGFDENEYVRQAEFDRRSIQNLLSEFRGLRGATLAFLESLSDEQLQRSGVANGSRCSVRALAWVLAGHEGHHLQIAAERYLQVDESEV